jgi:hypothetical protein
MPRAKLRFASSMDLRAKLGGHKRVWGFHEATAGKSSPSQRFVDRS